MRQSDINQAFRESVLRNSKGYQYLHTKDFVSALPARHSLYRGGGEFLERTGENVFRRYRAGSQRKPTVDNG